MLHKRMNILWIIHLNIMNNLTKACTSVSGMTSSLTRSFRLNVMVREEAH